MKIYIGGLTDQLADITDLDLRELFDPFGEIDFVDIHRDPQTGKCKGFAYVQYKQSADAKMAIQKMNNFDLSGKIIKVSTVPNNIISMT